LNGTFLGSQPEWTAWHKRALMRADVVYFPLGRNMMVGPMGENLLDAAAPLNSLNIRL